MNNPSFNDDVYKSANPNCEVLRWFPGSYDEAELTYELGQCFTTRRIQPSQELHHILGSSGGCKRVDQISDVIQVSRVAHQWLEAHKKAGMVLCLWIKRDKGELDWNALQEIAAKDVKSYLTTSSVASCCERFPWIEEMRLELVDVLDS